MRRAVTRFVSGDLARSMVRAMACSSVLGLSLVAGCASAEPRRSDRTAPTSLRMSDMGGTSHDVDAALARGETVALVFWQTWCVSCRREAPAIVEAQARHADAIRFFGVVPGRDDVVDDAEVATTAAEWGYDRFPQVRDRDLSLTEALEVDGTPTIVVLGPGRSVRYRGHRPPEDWSALRGAPVTASGEGGTTCEDGVCPLPQ